MKLQLDTYQWIGVVLGIVNFILFVYFFVAVSIPEQSYISTNLRKFLWFRWVTTTIITIQTALVWMFFYRFHQSKRVIAYMGISFSIISLTGWWLLAFDHNTPDHYIGFGIYVSAGGVQWIALMILPHIPSVTDRPLIIYFVLAFIFGFAYCVLHIMQMSGSWLIEHIAMLFLSLAYIVLFINCDPEEHKRPRSDTETLVVWTQK